MVKVRRSVKQKVVGTAAVAVLIAGASIATVSATGQTSHPRRLAARRAAHFGGVRDIATAAAYLGVAPAELRKQLSSGKTLAQVAQATSGKSVAGLTDALVAAHRARLASVAARLPRRVTAEVNRVGGPGRQSAGAGAPARLNALFARAGAPGTVAAGYLGVAPAQLRAQLHSGKTLAQVAEATPGRSKAGLLGALVTAKRTKLQAAAAAGAVTQAREAKRVSRLNKHVEALVQRRFAGAGSA